MNKLEYNLLSYLRIFKNWDGYASDILDDDISKLLNLARYHRVDLVIDHYINLPRNSKIINKLSRQSNRVLYETMFLHFKPVLEQLEKENIPYSINKGLYLALIAYDDIGDRVTSDIDILVDKSDLPKLYDILTENNFAQGKFDYENKKIITSNRREKLFYLSFSHQTVPFAKVVDNDLIKAIFVDINHHILWGEAKEIYNTIEIENFLRNTEKISYLGIEFSVLQIEYAILQLCLHMYNDMNSFNILTSYKSYSLRSFTDLYRLVIKNFKKINWELLNELCKRYKLSKYIYYTFYYTSLVYNDDEFCKLIKKPPDYTVEFANSLGLANNEIKIWRHDFWERIFSKDRTSMLMSYLNEDDIKKVKFNSQFI